ncbi:uncharacterized protein BDV17DRAFT_286786 [Aspergillus undulatus]|uniref:uncharacterized protein n=1 Tax=Aspergillus undulatus TaxID=1810928 RepID=UPI003CCD9125
MPVPLYQEQSQTTGTSNTTTQPSATGNNSVSNSASQATTTSFAGNNFPSAMNEQGQPLSKEEADRLYEERMEEEIAVYYACILRREPSSVLEDDQEK